MDTDLVEVLVTAVTAVVWARLAHDLGEYEVVFFIVPETDLDETLTNIISLNDLVGLVGEFELLEDPIEIFEF